MSVQDHPFDRTHTLVVTTSGDAAVEATATAAAVRAALEHADAVAVALDADALTVDHPDLAERFRTRLDDAGDAWRGPVDVAHAPLSDLLALTDVHRFVTLERLDAFQDGRRLLRYVPDHATFDVDATAASSVVDAVSRAVADESAGLLPAGTLADWYVDGARYELVPPSLCVGDSACFDLGALERVAFDDANHVIEVAWERDGGVLAAVSRLVGPDRPARFAFDSPNRYDAVGDAFVVVADALDVETTRTRT